MWLIGDKLSLKSLKPKVRYDSMSGTHMPASKAKISSPSLKILCFPKFILDVHIDRWRDIWEKRKVSNPSDLLVYTGRTSVSDFLFEKKTYRFPSLVRQYQRKTRSSRGKGGKNTPCIFSWYTCGIWAFISADKLQISVESRLRLIGPSCRWTVSQWQRLHFDDDIWNDNGGENSRLKTLVVGNGWIPGLWAWKYTLDMSARTYQVEPVRGNSGERGTNLPYMFYPGQVQTGGVAEFLPRSALSLTE